MPGLDGTGPLGLGPGRGWGRGYCGAGPRPGLGCGRGWRSGWWSPARNWRPRWGLRGFAPVGLPPAAAKEILEQEKAYLEQELAALEKRLAALQTDAA